MKYTFRYTIIGIAAWVMLSVPTHAAYLDECLTKVLPMKDGTYIAAIQCDFLDFLIYFDKDGKISRRNYVPKDWRNRIHLVDFMSDGKLFLVYAPQESIPLYRGMVCDFNWKIVYETGLEGMFMITVANGSWWGITVNEDNKPIIREISFDGFKTKDYPLPDVKGVKYFEDLISFSVDKNNDIVMLFCSKSESGSSGDGMIRRMRDGKMVSQWVIDVPHVPEMEIEIGWVGPITDEKCNVIVGHYENPCSAINDDRVRINKYAPNGGLIWTWGEILYLISDIRLSGNGTINILRPGGPVYRLTSDCKYIEQIAIGDITQLGEPECGKTKNR